jgi:hypothetical protein
VIFLERAGELARVATHFFLNTIDLGTCSVRFIFGASLVFQLF